MANPSVRLLASLLTLSAASTLAAIAPQSGRVVDPSGRAVPRALVRVLDAQGVPIAQVFTGLDGTFRVEVESSDCRLEASLTGFGSATTPCGTNAELALSLAPLSESIVVTATRGETAAPQLAASVTVFTADEIDRRQTPPVADLLATAPGVTVSRSGGYGGVTSMFVRGGESNYNKVLLDGIPLNEPGGVFNFSNITSGNLERIEIVRGAHSALFGSDAMASVVQLFTRRPEPGAAPRVGGTIEGGSHGTVRAQASVRGAAGRIDYSIGAAHLVTDNDEPNSEFRNDTVSAGIGYALTARATLRGVFRGEFGKNGTPGQTAFGRPDLDAYFDRRDAAGGVTFVHDVSASFRHRATYGLSTTRQDSVNLELDPPYTPAFEGRTGLFEFFDFPFHSRNDLRRHYASYQADWSLGGASATRGVHRVTAAVDWDGERGTVEDVLAGTGMEISRDNFGVTVQHQASWTRLFATAGIRFEQNDSFGSSAAPRGSLAIIARRSSGAVGETKLKASAGRGIKEPTSLQTFSTSPFFLGNPDLEPEESTTVDAGIEQRLANDRMRLEATWFENRFRNIIAPRVISFSPYSSQYFNIGRSEARGLELSAAAAPADGIEARAGYTLLVSKVVESQSPDDPVFGIGHPLFRRPRHSGFLDVSISRGPAAVSLTGLFVGRRTDSDFSALEPAFTRNDAYARWDARATYRLTRLLAFTLAADNISGADFMEPLGYRSPGRALRAGLRAGF